MFVGLSCFYFWRAFFFLCVCVFVSPLLLPLIYYVAHDDPSYEECGRLTAMRLSNMHSLRHTYT